MIILAFFNADIDALCLVFCGVINISPELNTDFECLNPKLEICHKRQHVFYNSEMLMSNFVLLYIYRITSNSC